MTYLEQRLEELIVLDPGSGIAPNACIIWLHGLGADGEDFVPLVPELHLPPHCTARFVFPHAPVRPVTINGGVRMRAWYDVRGFAATAAQDESGIRDSIARIEALIQAERACGMPARRIVLAGFSQGGAIALHAAIRHAEPLAGVLALSTYLPLQSSLHEASKANHGLPVLMCHGRADPVLPIALAEASRDVLLAKGYRVEWHEYPMQHQVCAEEIVDISAWLCRTLAAGHPAAA